jgi:hypothetical protein
VPRMPPWASPGLAGPGAQTRPATSTNDMGQHSSCQLHAACWCPAAQPEHTRHASAPSKFLCDYTPAMWPPTARRDCGQRRGAQRSTSPQRGTRHVGPASQQDAAGLHTRPAACRCAPADLAVPRAQRAMPCMPCDREPCQCNRADATRIGACYRAGERRSWRSLAVVDPGLDLRL